MYIQLHIYKICTQCSEKVFKECLVNTPSFVKQMLLELQTSHNVTCRWIVYMDCVHITTHKNLLSSYS